MKHKLPRREEKGKIKEVTNESVSTKTKDNKDFMMNVEATDMTTKKLVKHNKMHSKTKHNVDNMYSVLKKTKKNIKKAIKGQKKQKKDIKNKKAKKTKKDKIIKKTD